MTPKTVTIAAALAVGGVLLGMNYPIAEAQLDGPYVLSAGGSQTVWRMNTQTGKISLCATPSSNELPQCSPWGPATER
jgi:hypothetical protein